MANDNPDAPGRRESPLAAAARRMAEQRDQAAAPPNSTAPEQAQPVEANPQEAWSRWSATGWAPPEPGTRRPDADASSLYPPPPAAAMHVGPSYSAWWKRAVAALIDGVVISIPSGILFALAGGNSFETDPVTGQVTLHSSGAYVLVWVLTLVGSLVYYTLLEGGPGGATVGKLAMSIQVRTDSDLGPIGYGKTLGRRLMASLFWVLLVLPGLLDVLSPLWDARRQTWHDKVVGSVVVDKA